jgi:hypothetical protein
MTRSDLVGQLAEKFDKLTHRDTEFEALREAVDSNLPADESVLDVAGSAAP